MSNVVKITVFVVADNSEGVPEILAYDMSLPKAHYDNGDHYDIAKEKAEDDGYDPRAWFDCHDMAGQQLLGSAQMHGDEPRYATDILTN